MARKAQHTETEAAGGHKEQHIGSQGCNTFSSPMQAKVLHEACPSQASAVTQLKAMGQIWTLLREGALQQAGLAAWS